MAASLVALRRSPDSRDLPIFFVPFLWWSRRVGRRFAAKGLGRTRRSEKTLRALHLATQTVTAKPFLIPLCQAAAPLFFSFDFASRPYAIAAAVGSLTIRMTFLSIGTNLCHRSSA